jgi:hypothetical protein
MRNLSRDLIDLREQLSMYPEYAQTFSRTSVPQTGSIHVTGSHVFAILLERLLSVSISKKPMLKNVFEEQFNPTYPDVFYSSSCTRYADAVPENDIRIEVCKAVRALMNVVQDIDESVVRGLVCCLAFAMPYDAKLFAGVMDILATVVFLLPVSCTTYGGLVNEIGLFWPI